MRALGLDVRRDFDKSSVTSTPRGRSNLLYPAFNACGSNERFGRRQHRQMLSGDGHWRRMEKAAGYKEVVQGRGVKLIAG